VVGAAVLHAVSRTTRIVLKVAQRLRRWTMTTSSVGHGRGASTFATRAPPMVTRPRIRESVARRTRCQSTSWNAVPRAGPTGRAPRVGRWTWSSLQRECLIDGDDPSEHGG